MTKHLFTFVIDYLGGIYISQVSAPTYHDAMKTWVYKVGLPNVTMSPLDKEYILNEIGASTVYPITGCDSVWCYSFHLGKNFAIAHIVATTPSNAIAKGKKRA